MPTLAATTADGLMAPPRGTIGDRRAVRGSSDVRTLRARTAGCTLGAMCFLLLMALAALVASSTITRAEAQWWCALVHSSGMRGARVAPGPQDSAGGRDCTAKGGGGAPGRQARSA